MKISVKKEQLKFYLKLGLFYFLLRLFVDLATGTFPFYKYFFNEIWRLLYIVTINFIFFEYILPRLSRKKIFKSLFLLFFTVFLFGIGLYIWRLIGIQIHFFSELKTYESVGSGIGEQLGGCISSIFFFGIVKHIYDYNKLKRTAQQLRIEKQEAELNYLKSQTNPHFLFNTLNNIYSLSRDKSDLAPESILRLSKILRFMLYETDGEYIAIEQELKIIDDYIALEKLRYDESLRIHFSHDIEDMKQALPPLLLIPLVENAFKHGVSETRNQPFVDIHLSVNKRQLEFFVKNSTESVPEDRAVKENIGLSNLRRQLELLYKEYSLLVRQEETVFTAALKINLASHV